MMSRRWNSDDMRRRLERQVAQGDADAALRLVRELVRSGAISAEELANFVSREYWVSVVGRAHDAARKVEALLPRNEHQGYANYETFTAAVTLENVREFYEGWAYPAAQRLWAVSDDNDRRERDGSYSSVAVTFGDMIAHAVAGWAPEDPIRTFSSQNTKDLDAEIQELGRPWPRDRVMLGELFSHFLTTSLDRVEWREIGSDWLHRIVPESEGYGWSQSPAELPQPGMEPIHGCERCHADLTVLGSVIMFVQPGNGEALTNLDVNGDLVDIDDAIASGHEAGAACAACGERFDT